MPSSWLDEALAGYSEPHVALWQFLGASRQWFVLITCFAAFIIREPEPRWSLLSRLRRCCNNALGDIGVTKFTSDSLTIRAAVPFPVSALPKRHSYLEEGEYSPATMERHTSTRTEAEMIAAILAGDTQLYHELIHPHERCVYLMALSLMKNEADAEDIAQEAFLKAFRNLSTFRAESRFGTWLISITLNEARGRLRRQTIVRMESLDDAPDGGGVVSPALLRDWREIPSEVVERQEIRQMLQEAVINLPTIYREVFQLRDVEDLDVKETAEALGISVPSVKVRLHRARMMLQKQLSPLLKSVNPNAKRRWLPWL